MLFNPFLHDQSFVNQLGKREKLTRFRAKQPIIIASAKPGQLRRSKNRALSELIMSLL